MQAKQALGPLCIGAGIAAQAIFWRTQANDMRLDGLFVKKDQNPATIRVGVVAPALAEEANTAASPPDVGVGAPAQAEEANTVAAPPDTAA